MPALFYSIYYNFFFLSFWGGNLAGMLGTVTRLGSYWHFSELLSQGKIYTNPNAEVLETIFLLELKKYANYSQ